MDYVKITRDFLETHRWDNRTASRILNDPSVLRIGKYVTTIRPRGVLSGFLAIVPELGYAVFTHVKLNPIRLRLRVSKDILESGALFSAYFQNGRIVLEDVLVWLGKSVWNEPFQDRWSKMKMFLHTFKSDVGIQGCAIDIAKYMPLGALLEKSIDKYSVVEFVPNEGKRLIWIPDLNETGKAEKAEKTEKTEFQAKKENGPDVYSLWRGSENLGLALVRTLAVSKALRNAKPHNEFITVRAERNSQFDKYEILEVV